MAKYSSESAVILNILFKVYLAVASHGHARLSDVISRYLFVTDGAGRRVAQNCSEMSAGYKAPANNEMRTFGCGDAFGTFENDCSEG